jgi:AsmA protein
MNKPIKYGLLGVGGVVILALAAAVIFALSFDANRYKPEIERLAKERTGRTLKLQGNLQVAVFPSLGAKVAGLTLSERGRDQEFLALESAHASIALLPLLHGQVVVDGIRISGLKVHVVKQKDGRFNFSDLLEAKPAAAPATSKAPSEPGKDQGKVGFDIGSVQVERSSLSYRDLASGQELALSDLKLSTGRIAERAEGKLTLHVSAKGRSPDLDVKLDIGSDYRFDLAAKSYSVAKLDAKLSGVVAGTNLEIPVSGSLRADLEKQTANAELSSKFDDTRLQAKLGLTKFTPAAYVFDLNADRLNLDRYFPPEKKASAAPAPAAGKPAPEKQADTPVDLSALKDLNAHGRMQLGALQVRGLKLANLKAEVRAGNGRLDVAPHAASLYEGSVAGALTLQADGRVALKETLTGVAIGPLLRDVAQQDRLEGRGNLALDVAAAGKSVNAMKRSLAGTAKLNLRDGAIKGIDIAAVLRKAKSALGQQSAQAASTPEKTDFSEFAASFTIKNGVAHNEDLDVKAPLFRLTGRGDIDIGNSSIDYVTKAAVVATTQGQGGADLAQLSGLTVPVRLSGPFDAMKYQVDYAAAAADFAKSKAGEKIRERLEDRLKGLIGR